MTPGTGRDVFGRKLALLLPLVILLVVLKKSGVPPFASLALLLAVPLAAALVPAVARAWSAWGEPICFTCAIVGVIAVLPDDAGWGTTLGTGLTMGVCLLLLQAATARIARRAAA